MTYKTILADPPWAFKNVKTGDSHTSGAAQQYQVMTTDQLASLPVRQLADPSGSVLFLWATAPMLPDALTVMKGWGWTYKAMLIWHKTGRLGLGYWFRNEAEFLLLGVRGQVKAFRSSIRNVVEAPVARHSAKPRLTDKISSPFWRMAMQRDYLKYALVGMEQERQRLAEHLADLDRKIVEARRAIGEPAASAPPPLDLPPLVEEPNYDISAFEAKPSQDVPAEQPAAPPPVAPPDLPPKRVRIVSVETRQKQAAKMRERWAERRARQR